MQELMFRWRVWHVVIVGLLVLAAAAMTAIASDREISFEDRVKAQEAIERVYYGHQIGVAKPFEEAVPRVLLEQKVRTYLKESAALETYWKAPVTRLALESEIERMAERTRMPDRLRELFAALNNDPVLIRECLARQVLADRLARNFFAFDQRIHQLARSEADALQRMLTRGIASVESNGIRRNIADIVRIDSGSKGMAAKDSDTIELAPVEYTRLRAKAPAAVGEIGPLVEERDTFLIRMVLSEEPNRFRLATYVIAKRSWEEWWREVAGTLNEAIVPVVSMEDSPLPASARRIMDGASPSHSGFSSSGLQEMESMEEHASGPGISGYGDSAPTPRDRQSVVWTGNLMLVWGGQDELGCLNTGGRYDPITGTWMPMTTVNAPEARRVHTAVWTGSQMLIWGGICGDVNYNTGGRYDPVSDAWTAMTTTDAPTARRRHTAVWTGREMIVWGGQDSNVHFLNTGSRYDPESDLWTATTTIGVPEARSHHTAVWTGSEMIVWGGVANGGYPRLNTGGRYNPNIDSWTPTSTIGAPGERHNQSAIWTGTEMIVWGGLGTGQDIPINTGGRYDPVGDSWLATSLVSAPSARWLHTAVWTGREMIIWGGRDLPVLGLNTGARYDPVGNTWIATSTLYAPVGRYNHTAVWTGRRMAVWGGHDSTSYLDTGGRYDADTDSWSGMSGQLLCEPDDSWMNTSLDDMPEPRYEHSAVWTGSEMIVWGGYNGEYLNTGARYDPATDSWYATSMDHALQGRVSHTAVWTGGLMLIWGGNDNGVALKTGGRYDPVADRWLSITTDSAPSARWSHTAVWTGSEMIVWGGTGQLGYLNTGGRYDPEADVWIPTSTVSAPTPRYLHTAVWTESEMLVWGGYNGASLNTGGHYNPLTDAWTGTITTGAPAPRYRHTAVWTGSEMIVWGGYDYYAGELNTGGRYGPGGWQPTSTVNVPGVRRDHTAIWTGSRMIVWGGYHLGALGDGGKYDPMGDSWTPTTPINAAERRRDHTAVWTGSEMIVWGGNSSPYPLNTGGRYNPDADSWIPTSQNHAPLGRFDHTAIWTGNQMIVWGGYNSIYGGRLSTGGCYNPAVDVWSPTSNSAAPTPRYGHSAIWTGSEVIVWGGWGGYGTGGRYDPGIDTWTAVSTANAPAASYEHTAIWTGSEMIVWGGGMGLSVGGRYDPVTDQWRPTSLENAPEGRWAHNAVWTGSRMLVWGGGVDPYSGPWLNTGGSYDPVFDTWTSMTTTGAPEGRESSTAVWTGERMVIWGGIVDGVYINTGGRYDPATDSWEPTTTINAPSGRWGHTAVWTGKRMVIWGGGEDDINGPWFSTGGLYDPVGDSWTPTSTVNVPAGRDSHSAVWTSSLMLVWGGENSAWSGMSTGGIYAFGHALDNDGDGYTECQGDCNDGDPRMHPGAIEVCNNLDDDCDGVVDNDSGPPDPVFGLFLSSMVDLKWARTPGALSYDLVKGDLLGLRMSGGDFTSSLLECLANDIPSTALTDLSMPPLGNGYYYLIRANGCGLAGTYDSGAPSQQGSRDAEIQASPAACP